MLNPYRVLGVSRQATDEEIRRAYFNLVRTYPPEKDPDKFKEIRAAYDALKDRAARVKTYLLHFEDVHPDLGRLEKKTIVPALDFRLILFGDERFSDLRKTDFESDKRHV
jgi:curved DNA-binding protein CbpA